MLTLRFAKPALKALLKMPAGIAKRMRAELDAVAADPAAYRGSALMMAVFEAEDSIGKRAQKFIEGKLRQATGSEADIRQLEQLIQRMGNLLPICGDCNSTSNKGRKPVYDLQGFADWFHPYLRPGAGPIQLGYRLQEIEITLSVADPADVLRLHNLDNLLNLSARWTRKFKAGYISQQDSLKRLERKRLRQGLPRHSFDEIKTSIENFRDGLPEYEPFYEVQQVLAQALLEPARLAALQVELGEVT